MSGLDWFPTLVGAAGNPDIVDELTRGKRLGEKTYKVHLDGYNQVDMIKEIEKTFGIDTTAGMGEVLCGACFCGHTNLIREIVGRLDLPEQKMVLGF
mgnify:CR=1 FL=1